MPRIRVVFPTAWDHQQLEARPELWADDFVLSFASPDDADCPDDLDVLGYIDAAAAAWRGAVDGVLSSSDYPGIAVAAAIATALGLPAGPPATIMRAAHKGLARTVQAEALPDVTPAFQVIDPDRFDARSLTVPLPCFVKPAKGCFSVLARRCDDAAAVAAFFRDPFVAEYREHYLRIYRRLVARYLGPEVDGTVFVAEEMLTGHMVTVEGFVADGPAQALGVVDSLRHPRTGSFVGFRYPSQLPPAAQRRLERAACRLAEAFGLRWTMFNAEFFWDPATDRIGTVELNPRLCGQFADLYEKVDGTNGYRIALELAAGRAPQVRPRSGAFAAAASFPLRVFEPVVVARAPGADDLAAARAVAPQTLIWTEVNAGDRLTDFTRGDDGHSYRYAVVNLGGDSVDAVARNLRAVTDRLGYRFEPSGGP